MVLLHFEIIITNLKFVIDSHYWGLLSDVYDLILIFIVAHLEPSRFFVVLLMLLCGVCAMWTEHNIAQVSEAYPVSVFRLKVSRWESVIISSDYFNSFLMMEPEKLPEALKTSLCQHWWNPQNITDITFVKFSWSVHFLMSSGVNPLNAKLNPICHLLALLGARHIFHVSRIRVNFRTVYALISSC